MGANRLVPRKQSLTLSCLLPGSGVVCNHPARLGRVLPALLWFSTLLLLLGAFPSRANVDPGRASVDDWTLTSPIQLPDGHTKQLDLSALPHWMPAYMVRNISIPEPTVLNWVPHVIRTEIRSALLATGFSLLATALRPVMRQYRWEDKGFDNTPLNLSVRGTLWHMLSAGNLIRTGESLSVPEGLFRLFVLTNISPWLSNRLPDLWLFRLIARLPALALFLDKTLGDPAFTIKSQPQRLIPIHFDNQQLDRQLGISLFQPANTGPYSIIIEAKPVSTISCAPETTPATCHWLVLADQMRTLNIKQLHLLPFQESAGERLLLQTKQLEGSAPILIASGTEGTDPVDWWTATLQRQGNYTLPTLTLNPLSGPVIKALPKVLLALQINSTAPPPLVIKPERRVMVDGLTAMTDTNGTIMLLDWLDHQQPTITPRITLITDVNPTDVSLSQLSAIANSQPTRFNQRTERLYQLGHQTAWWLLAEALDALVSHVGDQIFRHIHPAKPRVRFNSQIEEFSIPAHP